MKMRYKDKVRNLLIFLALSGFFGTPLVIDVLQKNPATINMVTLASLTFFFLGMSVMLLVSIFTDQ